MTAIKLDSGIGGQPAEILGNHAQTIYDKPGGRWLGVVELCHIERLEPGPDSEKERQVKLRITGVELPTAGKQTEVLSRVMEALYIQRTASGTLDEDGAIQLHDSTLDIAAGLLHAEEAARLRVYLKKLADRISDVRLKHDLTAHGARAELRKLQDLADTALGRDIQDAEAGLHEKTNA